MKRFLSIFLLFITLAASAQFRWAPVAGVTVDNLKFKQDIIPVDNTVAFEAGIMGELMFPGIGFGMDFGLLYNMMGAKMDLGSREVWSSDGFGNGTQHVHALQIPLHLRFKWTRMSGLEDYIAPFVYGGPEFGIVVGQSGFTNEAGKHPFKLSGGDLGLAVGGGFELWRRWQVSVQYTWGMTYIVKSVKLDDFTGRNRQWAVRLAYMF